MAMEKSGYCDVCEKQKMFKAQGINHILHILLTFITSGLWGFVYGFLLVNRKFRCAECGSVLKDENKRG